MNAKATVSNAPLSAEPIALSASITVPAPVNALTNVPIKSITPKIGGPSVMNTPAKVTINPKSIPIAGCAAVKFLINSVIAIATSKTFAANGAIAVATLMIIITKLPSNDISFGPLVLT